MPGCSLPLDKASTGDCSDSRIQDLGERGMNLPLEEVDVVELLHDVVNEHLVSRESANSGGKMGKVMSNLSLRLAKRCTTLLVVNNQQTGAAEREEEQRWGQGRSRRRRCFVFRRASKQGD